MTVPTATYRLQLRGPRADTSSSGRAFGFAEAAGIVDYLADLGVSHLYLSPIMTAPPESAHGYDIVNPLEINPELGGIEGFRKLGRAAHDAGLGIIIDIVPNHVGVDDATLNPWWWDVLTYGKDSEFEPYFDIDWHADNGADGKLGLPVLGAEGDEDKIELSTRDGAPVLTYYDHVFPVRPGTEQGSPAEVYERQCYKLMFWRAGVIGYRRFFSVNGLAGIRQEDSRVFERTHQVLRQLIAEDLIDGVRVDHPDGLADPFGYLLRLRELVGPDRWLVAEKILAVDEPLDARLRVDGTTGYDALREFDGVFVNRMAEDKLSMLALHQTGSTWDEAAVAGAERHLKREVASKELAAEIRRLARAVRRDNFSTIGEAVPEDLLVDTIVELVAAMPVYRADYRSLSRVTATEIATMARRFPTRREALDVISAGLTAGGEVATRFAQVCGAVMAKGVEDTTFYRASRLVALQEVGGAPGRFGVSPAEFHFLQKERARLWPRAMTTLSTHDTKRGEDTRARMIEIAELPVEFGELAAQVEALTPAPDGATGHFLLQNLIGVWPSDAALGDGAVVGGVATPSPLEDEPTPELPESFRKRIHEYATKAMREAGLKTSWVEPQAGFEQSVHDWLDSLMDGPATRLIAEFVGAVAPAGEMVSIGRKLLQLIGPGIPDFYQGTEFIEDSLVDPDNRRFVDYTARRQGLARVEDQPADTTNLAKLRVVREALRLRREHAEEFADYHPVFASGPTEASVVGFARGANGPSIIALATRRPLTLARHGWQGTKITLPEGTWVDRLTGARHSGVCLAEDVLREPAALLVREELS